MKEFSFGKLLLGLGIWWMIFSGLVFSNFNWGEINNIVSFLTLLFVPGGLTLILFDLKGLEKWAYVALSAALSVLELMVLGYLCNSALPMMEIAKPLQKIYLWEELSVMVCGLAGLAFIARGNFKIKIKLNQELKNYRNWLVVLTVLALIGLSSLGAISLNNGGTNILTMIMLFLVGILTVYLMIRSEQINESMLMFGLFGIAIALLLMTSLRGWNTTGHDIQIETKVFELAKSANYWDINTYKDAYNACLSITILPTILSHFLKSEDVFIYKIYLQLFFGLIAPVVFLISRNWLDKKRSIMATIFFIGFPTFFEDMPFLVRQEVAFVFYSLMIYIIFNNKVHREIRRMMFLILGIGVVLSHYSTTYTILFIYTASVIIYWLFLRCQKFIFSRKIFRNSALMLKEVDRPIITGKMVTMLVVVNLLWTSTITGTGNNIVGVMKETLVAAKNGFTESSRSIDAVGLLSFSKPDDGKRMTNYIINNVNTRRALDKDKEYIDDRPEVSTMRIRIAKQNFLPLTIAGKYLEKQGINIDLIITLIGQWLSKFTEVAAVVGIFYVLFLNKVIRKVNKEFYVLGLSGFLFIAINVILPILSTEYGVYRAIQQAMVIMALFVVVGITYLNQLIFKKNDWLATVIVWAFIWYSTSFIPQFFGGNKPMLYLNNLGNYYDFYLTHDTEVAGIKWLAGVTGKTEVQADSFSQLKMKSMTKIGLSENIFPRLIKKNSFVFLGFTNVTQQRATIKYDGDSINYFFEMPFFDDNKNLIYNNGEVRIYK